jgi:hypothetical protein
MAAEIVAYSFFLNVSWVITIGVEDISFTSWIFRVKPFLYYFIASGELEN